MNPVDLLHASENDLLVARIVGTYVLGLTVCVVAVLLSRPHHP